MVVRMRWDLNLCVGYVTPGLNQQQILRVRRPAAAADFVLPTRSKCASCIAS